MPTFEAPNEPETEHTPPLSEEARRIQTAWQRYQGRLTTIRFTIRPVQEEKCVEGTLTHIDQD